MVKPLRLGFMTMQLSLQTVCQKNLVGKCRPSNCLPQISFTNGYDIDLEPRINVYEGWSGSNTAYKASQFGGVIDLSQGAEGSSYNWETDSAHHNSHQRQYRGGDGDDVVIGFAGKNSVEESKGNDILSLTSIRARLVKRLIKIVIRQTILTTTLGISHSAKCTEVDLATGAVLEPDDDYAGTRRRRRSIVVCKVRIREIPEKALTTITGSSKSNLPTEPRSAIR